MDTQPDSPTCHNLSTGSPHGKAVGFLVPAIVLERRRSHMRLFARIQAMRAIRCNLHGPFSLGFNVLRRIMIRRISNRKAAFAAAAAAEVSTAAAADAANAVAELILQLGTSAPSVTATGFHLGMHDREGDAEADDAAYAKRLRKKQKLND